MARGGGSSNRTTPTPSVAGSRGGGDEEEEYNPNVEDSDDDERTIAKDEDQHEDGEIDALKEEGDMPIEELLKMYGYVANEGAPAASKPPPPPSSVGSADGASGSRAERLK